MITYSRKQMKIRINTIHDTSIQENSNVTSRSNYVIPTQAKILITSVLLSEDCSLLVNKNTNPTNMGSKQWQATSGSLLKITTDVTEKLKKVYFII